MKARITTYIWPSTGLLPFPSGQVLGGIVQGNLELQVRIGIKLLEIEIGQVELSVGP